MTDEEYNQQVELARLFLQGKDQQVLDYLIGKMEQASRDLDFEGAARYRDQIQAVRAVIEKQFVSNERLDDMDIMSIAYQHGLACVQVMFIRQGKVLGNRSYFRKCLLIQIYLNSQPLLLGSSICKVIRAEVFLIVLLWIIN